MLNVAISMLKMAMSEAHRCPSVMCRPMAPEEDPPAELVGPEVDELVAVAGSATGVLGSYETPFAVAATWNTDPLPYS